MGWFSEDKPKTGSGTPQPPGTRARTGKVRVTFRTPDGRVVPQPTKKAIKAAKRKLPKAQDFKKPWWK